MKKLALLSLICCTPTAFAQSQLDDLSPETEITAESDNLVALPELLPVLRIGPLPLGSPPSLPSPDELRRQAPSLPSPDELRRQAPSLPSPDELRRQAPSLPSPDELRRQAPSLPSLDELRRQLPAPAAPWRGKLLHPQSAVDLFATGAATRARPGRSHSVVLSREEARAYQLLNNARRAAGLPRLRVDPLATKVARAHSADMCRRRFFSHTSPEGRSPWDRLRAAGARFSAAAENIALGQSSAFGVHASWMGSPAHRNNRMGKRYRRLGIGRVTCGTTVYWTEVLLRP